MRRVKPEIYLIGETKVIEENLKKYLESIGVSKWSTDAPSDSEKIIEVNGRLCYRSFEPGLNLNVTKIRESNKEYLENIVKVAHGSVLEHASVNFIFHNVSRVFTHELVRHRAGTAISQESLRFVRLDELSMWFPTCIRESETAVEAFSKTVELLEQLQTELSDFFELDSKEKSFSEKKVITSALRRIAPIGLATTIGWTANMRSLRWILQMRTHPSAEEEMRLVFSKVGKILVERYPHLFGDFKVEEINGYSHYCPQSEKI